MEYCDLNAGAEQRLEYFKERLRQRDVYKRQVSKAYFLPLMVFALIAPVLALSDLL